MNVCPKCGKLSILNSKFCSRCGTEFGKNEENKREEFIGKVYKCPNCGTEIPSLTAHCPGCGIELNSSRTAEEAKIFIGKVLACDQRIDNSTTNPKSGWSSWSTWGKIGWVILNLYTICIPLIIYLLVNSPSAKSYDKLTYEEKEKVNLINGYLFPDDRGTILEVLMFIDNQVQNLASQRINGKSLYWMMVWKNKADQLAQKSKLLSLDEHDVNIVNRIDSNYKSAKKKYNLRKCAIIAAVILILIIVMNYPSGV